MHGELLRLGVRLECAAGLQPTIPPYSSYSRVRSALAALKIAHPHEAVPVEPPATKALGRVLSPISSCTRSGGTSSASAAIWVSAVQAPVPMSVASMRTW